MVKPNDVDPKELGFYLALAQVGIEMVLFLGIGIAADHYLNWKPWGTIAGAVLGFGGGLVHLVMLVQRHDAEQERQRQNRGGPA